MTGISNSIYMALISRSKNWIVPGCKLVETKKRAMEFSLTVINITTFTLKLEWIIWGELSIWLIWFFWDWKSTDLCWRKLARSNEYSSISQKCWFLLQRLPAEKKKSPWEIVLSLRIKNLKNLCFYSPNDYTSLLVSLNFPIKPIIE